MVIKHSHTEVPPCCWGRVKASLCKAEQSPKCRMGSRSVTWHPQPAAVPRVCVARGGNAPGAHLGLWDDMGTAVPPRWPFAIYLNPRAFSAGKFAPFCLDLWPERTHGRQRPDAQRRPRPIALL